MACDEWSLWRGSLLPPGCVATLKSATGFVRDAATTGFTAATQPSGSKLPRHRGAVETPFVTGLMHGVAGQHYPAPGLPPAH
jgi:hypothetical protein